MDAFKGTSNPGLEASDFQSANSGFPFAATAMALQEHSIKKFLTCLSGSGLMLFTDYAYPFVSAVLFGKR
jgi:hypothetical protein